MFSLNLNGTFVLTMSKKSYFLQWGCPPQTAFTAVPLTSQHPLEKNTCCCVIVFSDYIQDHGAYKHKHSRIVS